MRKYTRVEGTPEVVSPEAHKAISHEQSQLGKGNARESSVRPDNLLRLVVDESDDKCYGQ